MNNEVILQSAQRLTQKTGTRQSPRPALQTQEVSLKHKRHVSAHGTAQTRIVAIRTRRIRSKLRRLCWADAQRSRLKEKRYIH